MENTHPLLICFNELTDPRTQKHSLRHKLVDILLLTILAVICGADNWVAVEKFGCSKREWLKTFLELPHGIPSHDVIGNVFSRRDPKQLQESFLKWIRAVFDFTEGKIIAIDGKTLCHSYDTASERPAIHMVSAWCCRNSLVLGQVKTDEKSNEITAIPKLLKMLDLQGHIITIDAMGCQKKIAEQIIEGGGDYVFNLKGNQSHLHDDVRLLMESHVDEKKLATTVFDKYEVVVVDADHGRIDVRRYWITEDIAWLTQAKDWQGLKSVGMVEYESTNKTTGKIEIERRCFISSLKAQAQPFAEVVRMHWGIENGLHWCLDVAFNEDACRVRKDCAPENFAIIRHIALNLLKNEKTAKTGIKNKRLMAGWHHGYLAKLLYPTNIPSCLARLPWHDTKAFGEIFIAQSDVTFNCLDLDSDYTADFINLLLYSLKESHSENIVIYPATTLEELPKYFQKEEDTKLKRYSFVAIHVPYHPESPGDRNHWAALITDHQEHILFYLDPATVRMPPAIEELRSHLNYTPSIILNSIDFQKAEKAENDVRHCGVYVVEIFKVFTQYMRSQPRIVDTTKPIKHSVTQGISFSSALRIIPYGLKEAAVHRQNHVKIVCEILKDLPPVDPVKKPLVMIKTEEDALKQQEALRRFCLRLGVSADKAQLTIIAFHEVLWGLLEARKTTGEVLQSGIISFTEKGNWAKIKKFGWLLLKSAPIAGKILKYSYEGCQIGGEFLGTWIEGTPWRVEEASWIEEVIENLEYVKTGGKAGHSAVDFFHDHWERFKNLHTQMDDYFRKWIDDSEVDTKREYKQFLGIFRTDAGKDALNRFVYRLIDRYARQIQLLDPQGAEQLAQAINAHLGRLFLLDFKRWNIPRWGAQKHAMMLEIMRQWVTYMGFLEEKPVTLASGISTTASALLQRCGIYFEGDQRSIAIDVMMDWDVQTKQGSMSDSHRYGYRKAESLLVEELKGQIQTGDLLWQAYEQQFAGQQTAEELAMLKELGHVMGVRFDPRMVSVFRTIKDITPCAEVVWESLEERTQFNEKGLDQANKAITEVKGNVSALDGRVDQLQVTVSELQAIISPVDAQKVSNPSVNHKAPVQVPVKVPLVEDKPKRTEDKTEKTIIVLQEKLQEANKENADLVTENNNLKIQLKERDHTIRQQNVILFPLVFQLGRESSNPETQAMTENLQQSLFEIQKSSSVSEKLPEDQAIDRKTDHNSSQDTAVKKEPKNKEPMQFQPVMSVVPTVVPIVFQGVTRPYQSTQNANPFNTGQNDKKNEEELAKLSRSGDSL